MLYSKQMRLTGTQSCLSVRYPPHFVGNAYMQSHTSRFDTSRFSALSTHEMPLLVRSWPGSRDKPKKSEANEAINELGVVHWSLRLLKRWTRLLYLFGGIQPSLSTGLGAWRGGTAFKCAHCCADRSAGTDRRLWTLIIYDKRSYLVREPNFESCGSRGREDARRVAKCWALYCVWSRFC